MPAEERVVAWQPLTPKGVAAFAHAPFGRLLLVQFLAACVVAGAVLWCLHATWFPVIEQTIAKLPSAGEIRSGILNWRGDSPVVLSENRFLSLSIDLAHEGETHSSAHVQIEFGRTNVRLLSLLGYLQIPYPRLFVISFNRTELVPWWGARSQVILAVVAGAVIASLLVTWAVLAWVYSGVVALAGYFANRDLPFSASWRLAGAALLPGAIFMAAGIVLYGLALFDPLRLAALFAVHLTIGWLYALVAPFQVRYLPGFAPLKQNPFNSAQAAEHKTQQKQSEETKNQA